MAVDNGDPVYVCEEHIPPMSGHYGDTGEWSVTGVVADEADAGMWVEQHPDRRRYAERTLGLVADRP